MINKSKYLTVRVDEKTRRQFTKKAVPYGGISQVLRELVDAFNDDRLTVDPDPNKRTLYVNRSKN